MSRVHETPMLRLRAKHSDHRLAGLLAGVASLLFATSTLAGVFGPGPNSTTIPSTQQDLSIVLTSPPDGSTITIPPGETTVTGSVSIGTPPGLPICLVYVVDVSGSTDGPAGIDANGDGVVNSLDNFNAPSGDTEFGEILDGEISGVLALHASIGNPPNVYTGLVAFASSAAIADVGSQAGQQTFIAPPLLDNNGTDGPDIEEVLRTFRSESPSGGTVGKFTAIPNTTLGNNTNFERALQRMNQAFTACPVPGATKIAFFLSDGLSNQGRCVSSGAPCADELAAANAAGTKINTIGVGAGADPLDLGFIAAQTGGSYTQVDDPSDLTTVLPGIDPEGIDRCEIDGDVVDIDPLGNFNATIPCPGVGPFTITATCYADDVDATSVSADLTLSCELACPLIGGQPDCSDPDCTGATCSDGNACTQTDVCQAGACVGSNEVVCSDPGQCRSAACNPATGSCEQSNDPNGTSCSDGDTCSNGDTCQDGACVSGPPLPNGTPCSDGNLCTTGDSCTGGVCSGQPVSCTGTECAVGSCNPNTGQCETNPLPDGTSCDADEDQCSIDACAAGVCTATGQSLPIEQCSEGVIIIGCDGIPGSRIRPNFAKPLYLKKERKLLTPGFHTWLAKGEVIIPDATFDPDSQDVVLTLNQNVVNYQAALPAASTPFVQRGSAKRPNWKFKLKRSQEDIVTAPAWRSGRFNGTPVGLSPGALNRVKYRHKGQGASIVVNPSFLLNDRGQTRIRETIRVGDVCYTSVLTCLSSSTGEVMRCYSQQSSSVPP